MNLPDLKQYVRREIAGQTARVSLLVHDYGTGTALLAVEPERKLVSASTIKVPILFTALEQVRKKALSLAQPVPVPAGEVLEDTEVFDRGRETYSLQELLTWMIISSDNTATNVLIDLLGMDAVNRYVASLDLKSTVLERKMLDYGAIAAGRNNYTSASDQLALFSALRNERILTPELCALARGILLRQRDTGMALRYLCPPDLVFAHKTGGLEHLNHDAGIFTLPGRAYFFGCFVTETEYNAEEDPTAKKLIGRLSEAVYRYWME